MTKLLLNNHQIRHEIKQLFAKASQIKCAVAFWGTGALNLFPKRTLKNAKIVCNLTTGGTNPDVIEKLQGRLTMPNRIKTVYNLHAKVYWTDQGVVITSANASANGLALQGPEAIGWEEAGVLLADPSAIQATKS